jgi:hypothetical protein
LWEKPALVSDTYASPRWRKFLILLPKPHNLQYRLYYGRYLCRSWNEGSSPEQQLRTLEIYFMREHTEPPGEPPTMRKIRLWRHHCFGKRGEIRQLPPSTQAGKGVPRSLSNTRPPAAPRTTPEPSG